MANLAAMRGSDMEKSRVNRIAKGYARGGGIPSDAMMANPMARKADIKKAGPMKKALGEMEGDKPKMRLDKFARGGAVKKGAKTNVNVIIAPQGGGGDKPPMPMPAPMAAAPAAMPPRPPMPLPGAPPGAMPPGLGPKPFKRGGKVGKYAKGGAVMSAGAESGLGRLQKVALQKRKG